MKIISILVVISYLGGCAKPQWLPDFPKDLNEMYLLQVNEKESHCLKYQIVKMNPVKFKYLGQAPMESCHELYGFPVDKSVRLFNWVDDVFKKAHEQNCFVNKPK